MLLLQNEISSLKYLIACASEKGMELILNPAPMDSNIESLDFSKINWIFLNEIEGFSLTGKEDPDEICDVILGRWGHINIVLTLGRNGSVYADAHKRIRRPIFDYPVADTTAAGDTFTGYFLNSFIEGNSPAEALKTASMASALAVSRKGASSSIPLKAEVLEALRRV
jgi:ribokinase